MHEDFRWDIGDMDDVCEKGDEDAGRWAIDMEDLTSRRERSWFRLSSNLENEVIWIGASSWGLGVRPGGGSDALPSRTSQEGEVGPREQGEAHGLGYGQRLDEMFAGTPSSIVVKSLLSVASETDYGVRFLDVKCALVYVETGRRTSIELP